MPLTLIFIAAMAAAQAPQSATGPGRPFLSPMGEPIFGQAPSEDGLTAWFEHADTNHDGALTIDEMATDAQRFFLTLDTNHDGEIDPDETTHYEIVIAPRLRMGNFGRDDEVASGRFGLLQIPEPVSSADSDFNRGVSVQEFRKAAESRFRLLDASHSGRLTLSSLEGIRHAVATAAKRPPQNKGDPDDQAILESDDADNPPM